MKATTGLLAMVVTVALGAAACGSDASGDDDDAPACEDACGDGTIC